MKTLDNLYADAIGIKPVDYDFGCGYTEQWDIVYSNVSNWAADKCLKWLDDEGYTPDEDIDIDELQGLVQESMQDRYCPMMNYYYSLPNLKLEPSTAQEAIENTCCTIVLIEDEPCLALAGGGMDLSWDICEAYMILGYLPPVHFCNLPNLAGKKLDENAQWVIDGCKKSREVSMKQAKNNLADLENLEQNMC